ncbi:hypothetical protein H6789_02725 [Candidatus Nomurabacteria bacterium]|nr:hypothetical protein [Candidatus Kaiserbacteria bacterium]MCB9815370.1 hypothetical protein [Candidatus Nomurabacteria bacterium]MCB9819591.1 hypothetical protein [Candidatus Nomurabacteria bacterium]
METISAVFFQYVQLLSSWWWLVLGGVTSISIVIISLRDDDSNLSLLKALQLSVVGLLSLFPFVRSVIPFKIRMDFVTRWYSLGLNTFWSFVLTVFTLSFLLAPLAFVLLVVVRVGDYILSGPFGDDIENYGVIPAVRLKFGARPEQFERKDW